MDQVLQWLIEIYQDTRPMMASLIAWQKTNFEVPPDVARNLAEEALIEVLARTQTVHSKTPLTFADRTHCFNYVRQGARWWLIDYHRRNDETVRELNSQSFEALRSAGVPGPVLVKLDPLRDRAISGGANFRQAVRAVLEDGERDQYLDLVVTHAKVSRPTAPPIETLPAHTGTDPVKAAQRREYAEKLGIALGALRVRERYLVHLRNEVELTFQDIGRRLGVDMQTARNRYFAILDALWPKLNLGAKRAEDRAGAFEVLYAWWRELSGNQR